MDVLISVFKKKRQNDHTVETIFVSVVSLTPYVIKSLQTRGRTFGKGCKRQRNKRDSAVPKW